MFQDHNINDAYIDLLKWNTIQSHILTGNGKLDSYSIINKDYKIEDLPHYLLKHKIKIVRQNLKWNWK